MKRRYAPAPGQKTIERGRQLHILRNCQLGDPKKRNDYKNIAKSMLRAIGDHLDADGQWTMYLQDLFMEIEVSPSAGYKWFAWLTNQGLLWSDPKPDGRHQIKICWSSLWCLTPQGRHEDEAEADRTNSSPPRGTVVHQVDHGSTTRNDDSTTWTTVPPGGIHNKEERSFSDQKSEPPPPPRATENPAVAVAGEKLISLGVSMGPSAVRSGMRHRSIDEISAIIDHFERELTLPNGRRAFNDPDPCKYLYWRVATEADLQPDQGWPKATAEFSRARYELREQQKRDEDLQAWKAARMARSGQ